MDKSKVWLLLLMTACTPPDDNDRSMIRAAEKAREKLTTSLHSLLHRRQDDAGQVGAELHEAILLADECSRKAYDYHQKRLKF